MAIRNDITVDWGVSPRLITVASPSVELSATDLFDTLRAREIDNEAMDEDIIVNAGGFEALGGGVVVGITVTLLNALVGFESRTGPSFTQCSISGGNVVALEDDLATYFKTPLHTTEFVFVVMANSSSATQSDLEAIQYASFQNGVWIDDTSSQAGTGFPSGNREFPVNNAGDALTIAANRGFDKLYVLGNYTFGSGHNIDGFTIEGQNAVKSIITIDPEANATLLEVFEAKVVGTLDGGSTLRECLLDNLNYINGFIHQCILNPGTIVLGGGATAFIMDSYSGVAGTSTPIIDMGGSGQGLALRNYSGGITITNKTGPDSVSIDLLAGQVVLDNTVTNGTIVVRGNGKVVDTSGNHILSGAWNGATIVNETPSQLHPHTLDMIAKAIWGALLANHTVANSFGSFTKKLLTVVKFLGLK